MNILEKIDNYLGEEQLFMHVRKSKKGLENLIRQYDDAKKYGNKKVLDKLKKEIDKTKKSIEKLEKK